MCGVKSPLSLGMTPERVAGISDAVLRSLNARNISSLLGVSVPQAKRVVNLS
jgi:hypothetical protein